MVAQIQKFYKSVENFFHSIEVVVVAQRCNPLALQSEQSVGVGSIPGRIPPLERHYKG